MKGLKDLSPSAIESLLHGSLRDPRTPGLTIDVLPTGKKRWRYRRQIAGARKVATLFGGRFPTWSIGAAREWARHLNESTENGIDPRVARREEAIRNSMTVARAHELYMEAVRDGRSSRAKRLNKPRTIRDKIGIFGRDIAPFLGHMSVYSVTEDHLVKIVIAKGKLAKIRANRLAAELRVFFGWASSLRGSEVGLMENPARRLADLRFPEVPRQRKLSLDELELLLKALAEEGLEVRRAMLLWLLTATRRHELLCARSSELVGNEWTIPAERSKNGHAHTIRLGPWGRSLLETNSEWLFPAERVEGPRKHQWYYIARDRIVARMSELAGRPIDRFTPHDFRRTARSNTKRLKVDYETAEAMMNHLRTGMERIYDGYKLEEEMAVWFRRWEQEIARIARKAGVAEALGVPVS